MSSSSRFLMEKTWERIQQKTFTKWINSHMSKKGLEVTDVQEDFENGIKLVQFLEIIGEDEIKYNKNPRIRIQKIENVNRALEYLKSKNVHLVAISSENIVDKDLKLILGMIWTIIQKFAIADISEEELSARDALLLWCKKKTAGYKDVSVKNFHYSWQDGLAFCALIHKHRPDLIDFDSLDKENKTENLNLAFDVAEKEFGIYKLLDAEDMVDIKPDERSVITYVAQYYHVFASSQKAEVAGRRIGNLIDMNKQHEDMKKDYTTSASALIDWINATTPKMEEREFDNSLAGARAKVSEFDTYRNTEKPPKVADKAELENKFNRIQIALRNAGRPVYVPADGQAPADVNQLWDGLQSAEDARSVALQEEVERQEKIEKLTRLFNLRTKKMEDWLTAKEAYLSTVEEVHSLNEAETKLKFLDAFGEEYAASKSNLDEINTLASSIKALTAANADDVQARAQAVDGRWNALQGQADGKRADLDEKLARQRKMEELRKEFASQATAYQSHVKKASNNAKDRNFGQSLESVQAYRSELESTANEAKADSENKKASLDSLWSEMEAIGIKENRYTPLTNTDIASSNAALAAAFDKRAQAYEEELKRQELLEAKRKEFAEKAQQFVDSVDGRRDSINALEGEPQPLIAAINDSYQNGAPEDQSLAAISALATEMAKLGISDNKHTKHTVPGLNVVKNKFGADVRNKVIALQEEDEAKQSYARRAAALQEWAAAKTPAVGSIGTFDNTQAGAEAAYAEWTAYKTGEKAERENEVAAVAGLADKIAKLLADNNRPAFSPASEEIDAAFAALKEAEAAREAELNEELARQEKLTALVKRFNSEAADHETWSENKQVYLNKEEQIASLTAANVQAAFLDEYNKDYTKRRAALDSSTLPVASEIEGLNYHDAATVRGRADALVANFDGLTELASAKGQAIAAAREAEENKERLRVEFAKSAKAFSTYTRVTVEAVSNTNFGSSLEDMEAAQADIASSDADINNTADAKKTEADGLSQELAAAGVSENPHTTLTDSDVTAFRQQIADAINKRSADYGSELSKQQEHESMRKAWAADAEAFAEWVGAQRSALDGISGDNKIADAQALHGGGAEGKSKIGGLQAGTAEMAGLGIYENKHTKYTQPILENLNAQYDDAVAAFVSTAEKESALATCQEQLQKDHDEHTRKENLRVEFETSKQKPALWLGNTLDVVEDPIDCESVDDVNEFQAAYDKVVGSVPQAEHDNAHKLLGEVQEAGVTGSDLGNEHEQWEEFQSSSASRKSAIRDQQAGVVQRQLDQTVDLTTDDSVDQYPAGLTSIYDTDDVFIKMGTMGEGSFGLVYQATFKQTGQVVAVKECKIRDEFSLSELTGEIAILRMCNHPNVVKFVAAYIKTGEGGETDTIFIVMELAKHDVEVIYLLLERHLEECEIAYIFLETAKGIAYLHKLGLTHRDIKGANILVTSDGRVMLADFGVSAFGGTHTTAVGTPYWIAPEVMNEDEGYNALVDIWSLGIVGFEMLQFGPPGNNLTPSTAMLTTVNSPSPVLENPDNHSALLVDLLRGCLEKNPADRFSADEVLKHAFLKSACTREQFVERVIREVSVLLDAENGSGASCSDGESPDASVPLIDRLMGQGNFFTLPLNRCELGGLQNMPLGVSSPHRRADNDSTDINDAPFDCVSGVGEGALKSGHREATDILAELQANVRVHVVACVSLLDQGSLEEAKVARQNLELSRATLAIWEAELLRGMDERIREGDEEMDEEEEEDEIDTVGSRDVEEDEAGNGALIALVLHQEQNDDLGETVEVIVFENNTSSGDDPSVAVGQRDEGSMTSGAVPEPISTGDEASELEGEVGADPSIGQTQVAVDVEPAAVAGQDSDGLDDTQEIGEMAQEVGEQASNADGNNSAKTGQLKTLLQLLPSPILIFKLLALYMASEGHDVTSIDQLCEYASRCDTEFTLDEKRKGVHNSARMFTYIAALKSADLVSFDKVPVVLNSDGVISPEQAFALLPLKSSALIHKTALQPFLPLMRALCPRSWDRGFRIELHSRLEREAEASPQSSV